MLANTIIDIKDQRVKLKNDGELLISTGKSVNDVKWRAATMHWSVLLSKLSNSRQTPETHAEFMRMSTSEQTAIKDVGGFVGGRIQGGRRLRVSIKTRQILTLDADFAPPDLWDQLMEKTLDGLDCAMAVYSTHKHCAAKPRLRVVIPLAREVPPEEYEAIARKVAEIIGIDYFDDTTYEPHRLMFWPSHSADVDPVFEYYDAAFLDPDNILRLYYDWTDVLEWPMSSREKEVRQRKADKVEDPLGKKGLVGIFCRTYTISAAIEKFLPGVYTPTVSPDRWTYANGSTFGGLVIYDDDHLAYSHHSTDPAALRDLNAFDLVRIHKFGHLDEASTDDTPMNRRPSWKAMIELIGDDPDCMKTRDAEAAAEFREAGNDDAPDWMSQLIRNENLTIKSALVNATLILENDEELSEIRLNELIGRIEAERLPWLDKKTGWADVHDSILTDWIARKYGVEFPVSKIRMALEKVSFNRRYHPIRDYLDGLPAWDGTERVDRLLVEYLEAEDTIYVREATRKALMAAVARVYRPGIKFDSMLVLVGPQGAGKSGLFTSLAGEWFTDSLKIDMMNDVKKAGEQLQGVWIAEIGEMAGMKKAEVEDVKSFITRKVDSYRDAFGHYKTDKPRQCIIVGSTNQEDGFLRDTTGNRRFWPVKIKKPDVVRTVDMPRDLVDQIWAEAKVLWETEGDLLLSKEALEGAEEAQREAIEQDERQGIVEEYLERLLPANWDRLDPDRRMLFLDSEEVGTVRRKEVSNIEIWVEALKGSGTRMTTKDSYDISKIMAKVPGWTRTGARQYVTGYGRQRIYRRLP